MISHKNIYFYALLCLSTNILSESYFKEFFIGNQRIAYAQGDTESGKYQLHIQIQPEYASLITFASEEEKQQFDALLETIKTTRKSPHYRIFESDEEIEELLQNAFHLFCKQRKTVQVYSYRLSNGAQGHVLFLSTFPKDEPDDCSSIDQVMQANIDNWSTPKVKTPPSSPKQEAVDQSNLNEDDDYWKAQTKYLVKEEDYCGEIPEELQRYVMMINNPEPYKALGVYKSSGFIFYGPPGTGKTFLASIFAQKIKADFMYVKGDDLIDNYQASGMRKPAELFEKARKRRDATNSRVAIFIDEIDTVVNGDGHHEGTLQLVGSLLKELGSDINHDIYVIAATNRFNTLNKALLRSGRLQHHVKFELPDKYDRRKMLEFLTRPYSSSFSPDIRWDKIADITDRYSQADLKKLMETVRSGLAERIVKKSTETKDTEQEKSEDKQSEKTAEPLIITQKDIEKAISIDLKKARKSQPNQGYGQPWWGA